MRKILFVIMLAITAMGFVSCKEPEIIHYPAVGMYGDNILSIAVKYSLIDGTFYSMKADVPKGQSLKIVLKGRIGYYTVFPNPPLNWNVSQYDEENSRQECIVIESGKPCDMQIHVFKIADSCTIEYYENGSVAPTKTKTLKII